MISGLKDKMVKISSSAKKIVCNLKEKFIKIPSYFKNAFVWTKAKVLSVPVYTKKGFVWVKETTVKLPANIKKIARSLWDKIVNMSSTTKRIITASTASVFVIAVTVFAYFAMSSTVVIVDGDNAARKIITFKNSVAEVLAEQGIRVGGYDKMSVAENTKLRDDMVIQIDRAYRVSVVEKGFIKTHIVTARTAGAVLNEAGYDVKETDKITPGYNEKVSAGEKITLIRCQEKMIEVVEEIPYESKTKDNAALASGRKKVVQKGKPGEMTVSYKVYFEDGVEVSREKVSEEVITPAIEQITEVGTQKAVTPNVVASAGVKTSRSGNLSYSKVLSIQATAYDASSCGKSPSHPGYGITATGRQAVYGVVAVDPSVIPLGSRLYIETPDGSYVYGTAVAADTGGAIKGNRIDLCFNTRQEALNFGRRQVNVYVLN